MGKPKGVVGLVDPPYGSGKACPWVRNIRPTGGNGHGHQSRCSLPHLKGLGGPRAGRVPLEHARGTCQEDLQAYPPRVEPSQVLERPSPRPKKHAGESDR